MGKRKEIKYEVSASGCHICTSHAKTKAGYSVMRRDKKTIYIHRVLYEEKFGKIPDGLHVRHKCDNPNCINVEHMELGTPMDNVQDKINRGRQLKGEGIGNSKLTEGQVLEIFHSKLSTRKLGKVYGISSAMVCMIKNKKRWGYLFEEGRDL